jgi:hypothetical protein
MKSVASFETADPRLPQDDGGQRMPLQQFVMRSACKGRLEARILAFAALALLLASCHGGTLDAIYPGELGHSPPPAVNLPPQDAGLERL